MFSSKGPCVGLSTIDGESLISFSPIEAIIGRELGTKVGEAVNELEDGKGDSTCVIIADGNADGCTDGFVVGVDGFDDGEGTRGSIVGIVVGRSKCVVVGVEEDSLTEVGVIDGIALLFNDGMLESSDRMFNGESEDIGAVVGSKVESSNVASVMGSGVCISFVGPAVDGVLEEEMALGLEDRGSDVGGTGDDGSVDGIELGVTEASDS